MKSIGIRALKATLSRCLEDVKRGDVLLVTDRGRVVAEIRPPGSTEARPGDAFAARLQPWIVEGRVSPGPPNDPRWYPPSPLNCPAGTAAKVLDELRGES